MKIAISALHVRTNYNPSQEVYAANLLKAMRGRVPNGMEVCVLVTAENRALFPLDGFQVFECPFIPSVWKRLLWEQRELPRILKSLGAQLYHGTGNNALFRFSGRQMITLHYVPEYRAVNSRVRLLLAYRKWMMGRSIRAADGVICASDFLKRGVAQVFGIDGAELEKIGIIPMGVDTELYSPTDPGNDEETLLRYGVKKPYFFGYADILALKNESRIFHAWAAMRRGHGERGRCFLALMGDPASAKTHSAELADMGGLNKDVIFTGFVSRRDLAALYRGAHALIYPSLVESFGLCILESMACGTPVLTSNITAMPEVAGGAALLVDPHSESEIRAGMERLLFNEAEYARLRAAGLERARTMSWDETAAKTIALYSSLLIREGAPT